MRVGRIEFVIGGNLHADGACNGRSTAYGVLDVHTDDAGTAGFRDDPDDPGKQALDLRDADGDDQRHRDRREVERVLPGGDGDEYVQWAVLRGGDRSGASVPRAGAGYHGFDVWVLPGGRSAVRFES